MAISLIGTIQRLQCLSTDDKPLNVPEGTEIHVIDTGEQYIMHDGMWEPDLRLTRALEGVL